MVEEKKWIRILQVLNRIDTKLEKIDEIVNLLKMSQKMSIEQTKIDLLGKSEVRRATYKLCDGRHTVSGIAQELGKPISLISQNIAKLKKAGLINEERQGKQKYYRKAF